MNLNFGNMRYVIEVQESITSKDQYGSQVEVFSTIYTLRAQIKYVSGNKGLNNEEIFTSQVVQFFTHYRDINEKMIILFNDKKYKINFIEELGFKEGLSINCELINE